MNFTSRNDTALRTKNTKQIRVNQKKMTRTEMDYGHQTWKSFGIIFEEASSKTDHTKAKYQTQRNYNIFTGTDNLFGKIVNWSVVFISRLECTCCATSRFSVFSPNICDGRPIKANLQTTNWIFLDTGDVSGDFFKLVNKELFTSTKVS